MTMFLGWFTHIRVSVYGFKIPEALQVSDAVWKVMLSSI